MLRLAIVATLVFQGTVNAGLASTYAGATSSAVYPPPGATAVNEASLFPDGSVVGYAGPTATGDEPEAIATAPAVAKVDSVYPLVKPNTADNGQARSFNILQSLGNLSPWQSVSSLGLPATSPAIPKGCSLNQVHILHRHGARYPTGDAGTSRFAANIHAAAANGTLSASGPLSFLNTWTFKLGAEILTPFGRQELFDLGVGFRVKYGDLLKGFKNLPVFRTTSQARMLDSALHFAAGFFGVQSYQSDYHQLISIEQDGFNNTLAAWTNCANANNDIYSYGSKQANKWAAIYLKSATKRIQSLLKGYTLVTSDLVAMQQMCAYETVSLGFSEFCDLFTEEEWKGFEYYIDLQFWYSAGPGNPASSAQGIGYVQELVARLTKTPITTFDSAVNSTIASNPKLFPLDQPIFVDASHDTVMTTIFTAMNFTSFAKSGPLPTDRMSDQRSYKVNQLAPFATNLVGQVLSCPASSTPTHIRWILNDAAVPLTGIKGCKANKDGLCDINTFIAGMKQRITEVDFNYDCGANYTIPEPDRIIDGQYPKNLRK